MRVIHTPGHTAGSICLYLDTVKGPALISGDTLFPGGPGRCDSNAALQQMIQSIVTKLHVLPEETLVYPGHGDDTTIADSKKQYAVYASREHAADQHGDVTWEGLGGVSCRGWAASMPSVRRRPGSRRSPAAAR